MTYLILGDPDSLHTMNLLAKGVACEDITVWEDSKKGMFLVSRRGCRVVDDLEDLEGMRFDIVIGNPPYGNAGNQAIQFLNRAGDFSDDIRLVLPLSVRKHSARNKIRLDFECIDDERLPDDTFPGSISTCYQRWVRTDTPREKIKTVTSHPDFVFCDRHDLSANVFIMRVGYAGKVMTTDFDSYREASSGHFFLRVTDDAVIERLQGCEDEFRRVAEDTNGLNVLSKHELISIYSGTPLA